MEKLIIFVFTVIFIFLAPCCDKVLIVEDGTYHCRRHETNAP